MRAVGLSKTLINDYLIDYTASNNIYSHCHEHLKFNAFDKLNIIS
jgi:hypothetical protein